MFTLRQIFLIVSIVAVISFIVSMGLAGQGWAMGVAFGVLYLLTVGLVMWLSFSAVELFSEVRGAIESPDVSEFSPFRSERPEKLPDQPEQPDLERMMPGWSAEAETQARPESDKNGSEL